MVHPRLRDVTDRIIARSAPTRDACLSRITAGGLTVLADRAARRPAKADLFANQTGAGRKLFATFRATASTADTGASIFARIAA